MRIVQLHRNEPHDPASYYEFLARDTCAQLRGLGARLDGDVLDVGGGPGYVAREIDRLGGACTVLEASLDQIGLHGHDPTPCTVLGDGQALPFPEARFDVVHCSNVLEHVPRPFDLLGELNRVLRPGGVGYLSFTPWLSPWGGHETSPWHYAGGHRAARRFRERTGRDAKNLFGSSLFEVHIPEVRTWYAECPDVEVDWIGPRYWPPSWSPVSRLPVVGEIVTWNLLVLFRRRPS
jgi:SAM-dependent methyltransferase